jgi:hypothetical protein
MTAGQSEGVPSSGAVGLFGTCPLLDLHEIRKEFSGQCTLNARVGPGGTVCFQFRVIIVYREQYFEISKAFHFTNSCVIQGRSIKRGETSALHS